MPSIKFYLNHPKVNGVTRKTPVSVVAKVNCNGQRFEIPTGERIIPKDWNPATQRAKSSYRGGIELNQALDDFAADLMRIWRKDRSMTAAQLRAKFQNRSEKKTLFAAFDNYIQQGQSEKELITVRKYRTTLSRLQEFDPDLDFAGMDHNFYDRFKQFLYDQPNPNYPNHALQRNGDHYDIIPSKNGLVGLFDDTVYKYIKNVKALLKWAQKRGYPVTDFEHWPSPSYTHKPISLTLAELEQLENCPLSGNLAIARDYLAFECRTGQRISDVKRFDLKNFDGQRWTFYPRKGNRLGTKQVTVHFTGYCERALDILARYNYKMPDLSEQKINKNIKLAAKAAGIDSAFEIFRTAQNKRIRITGPKYEFISTHTGRKTFITIALQFMPPDVVMDLTGISDYKTLKHYKGESDHGVKENYLTEMGKGIMRKAQ